MMKKSWTLISGSVTTELLLHESVRSIVLCVYCNTQRDGLRIFGVDLQATFNQSREINEWHHLQVATFDRPEEVEREEVGTGNSGDDNEERTTHVICEQDVSDLQEDASITRTADTVELEESAGLSRVFWGFAGYLNTPCCCMSPYLCLLWCVSSSLPDAIGSDRELQRTGQDNTAFEYEEREAALRRSTVQSVEHPEMSHESTQCMGSQSEGCGIEESESQM